MLTSRAVYNNSKNLSNTFVPTRRVPQTGVGRKTMNPHLRRTRAWKWQTNWISVVILDELIMIILLLLSTSLATDKNCLWHDTFGYSYDISKLHNINNYQVPDTDTSMGMFNMVYEFNFCTGAVRCQGRDVAAFEALEVMGKVTENCDVLSQSK